MSDGSFVHACACFKQHMRACVDLYVPTGLEAEPGGGDGNCNGFLMQINGLQMAHSIYLNEI